MKKILVWKQKHNLVFHWTTKLADAMAFLEHRGHESENWVPTTWFLSAPPGCGKTTLGNWLSLNSSLSVVDGDMLVVVVHALLNPKLAIKGETVGDYSTRVGVFKNKFHEAVARHDLYQEFFWTFDVVSGGQQVGSCAVMLLFPEYAKYAEVLNYRDHDTSVQRKHTGHPVLPFEKLKDVYMDRQLKAAEHVDANDYSVITLVHSYAITDWKRALKIILANNS